MLRENNINEYTGTINEGFETRELLLSRLPVQLREKWDEAPIEQLIEAIEKRKELNYEHVTGYHVSDKDLAVGSELLPDNTGGVYYADKKENLYGRHGGGFLYIIEGTSLDAVINHELGWKKTMGKVKIIDKIKITPEAMNMLGARFAKVEYH